MPSFLINEKMSPALAARVRRSLKARSGRTRLAPGALSLLRLATGTAIIACAVWLLSERQSRANDLEIARDTLLQRQRAAAARVSNPDELANRLESWLVESAGVYSGDTIDETLKDRDALTRLLRRPGVYVRGPITALGDHATLGPAATESTKDALLSCLVSPPAGTDEANLLEALRKRRDPGGLDATAHVERLHAALAGLPVLSQAWAERIRGAADLAAVKRLDDLFRLAPIAAAQHAARAELFIFALDEPKTDNSPSEFDGTTRHLVRVHVVELGTSRVLLRLRRLVDPVWLSEKQRHRYADALTACRLAADVHAAVDGETAPVEQLAPAVP